MLFGNINRPPLKTEATLFRRSSHSERSAAPGKPCAPIFSGKCTLSSGVDGSPTGNLCVLPQFAVELQIKQLWGIEKTILFKTLLNMYYSQTKAIRYSLDASGQPPGWVGVCAWIGIDLLELRSLKLTHRGKYIQFM